MSQRSVYFFWHQYSFCGALSAHSSQSIAHTELFHSLRVYRVILGKARLHARTLPIILSRVFTRTWLFNLCTHWIGTYGVRSSVMPPFGIYQCVRISRATFNRLAGVHGELYCRAPRVIGVCHWAQTRCSVWVWLIVKL